MGMTVAAVRTDRFSVKGMTCGACVKHVEEALLGLDEVTKAKVNLKKGRVRVAYASDTDPTVLFDAVREAGYEMGPI